MTISFVLTLETSLHAVSYLAFILSTQELIQIRFTFIVTQENHQRVNIFFDYAKKTKNTAWSYFLPMLNRQDLFTVHMVSYCRSIAQERLTSKQTLQHFLGQACVHSGLWENICRLIK